MSKKKDSNLTDGELRMHGIHLTFTSHDGRIVKEFIQVRFLRMPLLTAKAMVSSIGQKFVPTFRHDRARSLGQNRQSPRKLVFHW